MNNGERVGDVREGFRASGRLGPGDAGALIAVFLFNLVLQGYRLGRLEFFRHTEADRTLIGWEMVERGDYLVPHLLGSEIITKPPLYYWALVGSFRLFGEVNEWTARAPSVLFAALLVLLQYLVTRRVGWERGLSLVSALMLSTGMLLLSLSSVAEIDMLLGLLSAVSLYSLFFGLAERRPALILLAYLTASAAFLVKGPPIVFFFAAALVAFYLWQRLRRVEAFPTPVFLIWNLAGVILFSIPVMLWLLAVAQDQGWPAIYRRFDVEVVQRVFSEARQPRGPLFYLIGLVPNLAPWSIIVLIAAYAARRRSTLSSFVAAFQGSPPRVQQFFVFSILTSALGVLMLSIAESKSSRYVFPIYPFLMNIPFAVVLLLIAEGRVYQRLRVLRYVAPVLAFFAIAGGCFVVFRGIADVTLFVGVLPVMLIACWMVLVGASGRRSLGVLFLGLLLLILGLRMGEREVYAPYRNKTRSVKAVSREIHAELPPGASILTIEMFERWIVYYLKHLGRESIRITPRLVAHKSQNTGRVFILLNADEESWRIAQLGLHDPTLRVIKRFDLGKDSPLLIEADSGVLAHVRPHEDFPTFPSAPYYTNEERRLLGVAAGANADPSSFE